MLDLGGIIEFIKIILSVFLLFGFLVVSDSLWPHGLQHARLPCPSPSLSLFKLMSIESVMPSNHLTLCYHLLLPSTFPSIGIFSKESVLCVRWPKYWSFSISPFNEYLGLISFKVDWFNLLAVQETLQGLLQPSLKALILQPSLCSDSHIHTWWLEKPEF